jgi:hypothetical protein
MCRNVNSERRIGNDHGLRVGSGGVCGSDRGGARPSVGAVPVAGRKMCDGDVYAGSPLRRP